METLIIKLLLPSVMTFCIGILIAPILTHYLYKYKVWKKEGGKLAIGGHTAVEFNRLKGGDETKIPRMGGVVIWGSVFISFGVLYGLSLMSDNTFLKDLFFLSRSQTWIPAASLLVGALLGFLNDFYDVQHGGKGVKLSIRLGLIILLSTFMGWWFYEKLGVTSIGIPFFEPLYIGFLIIPFFVLLTMGLYASGVIDGIDGLSGGVFAIIFSAYGGVAVIQSQFDLAAFCLMITGGILAFLWFNIPPARFWMTETGTMSLTLALAAVVMMTDDLVSGYGVALLPIIGFLLVITVLSNVVQIFYRKLTGKKLLRIAPLHHHFEAIGWPSYKVTMRYWIISMICAGAGLVLVSLI